MHFSNHSLYSKEILESISRFVIDLNIREPRPKFYIFVEGDSEEIVLPILFQKNQFLVYEDYEIINLKGKDTIQRPSIRELLKNFNTPHTTSFLILDNDKSIRKFIDDLVTKKLIEEKNVILWKKDFEDSVPIEFSIPLLANILSQEIDINVIKKYNKKQQGVLKTLKKYFHDTGVNVNIGMHKKAWAKSIAENIDNCYGKIYKYKPEYELERQVFRLKNIIREKNHVFYMPTKNSKKGKYEVCSSPMNKPYKVIE
jgi:predicted ATP-dependent endonuclease of OLD family